MSRIKLGLGCILDKGGRGQGLTHTGHIIFWPPNLQGLLFPGVFFVFCPAWVPTSLSFPFLLLLGWLIACGMGSRRAQRIPPFLMCVLQAASFWMAFTCAICKWST